MVNGTILGFPSSMPFSAGNNWDLLAHAELRKHDKKSDGAKKLKGSRIKSCTM